MSVTKGLAALFLLSAFFTTAQCAKNLDDSSRLLVLGKISSVHAYAQEEIIGEGPIQIIDASNEDLQKEALKYDQFEFLVESDQELLSILESTKSWLKVDDKYIFHINDLNTAKDKIFRPFHKATFVEKNTGQSFERQSLFDDALVPVTDETALLIKNRRLAKDFEGHKVKAAAFPFPPYSIPDFEGGKVCYYVFLIHFLVLLYSIEL